MRCADAERREAFFGSRHGRNLAIAIAASLLFHALVLFVHSRHRPLELKPLVRIGGPLSVELVPLKPSPKAERHVESVHPRAARRIIAARKSRARSSTLPESGPAPKMSFLDYVNAARRRRDAATNEYPVAPQPVGPFQDRGVHPNGTSGIFRILKIDDDSAEVSFLGWHSEYSNAHRQVFDVEAGPDGNIRLAVVRRMIEIIRHYYDGNFNWESDRLGGEVVLSARLKDNAELEAFLMKEFFWKDAPP